jgi:hypothetical protein
METDGPYWEEESEPDLDNWEATLLQCFLVPAARLKDCLAEAGVMKPDWLQAMAYAARRDSTRHR